MKKLDTRPPGLKAKAPGTLVVEALFASFTATRAQMSIRLTDIPPMTQEQMLAARQQSCGTKRGGPETKAKIRKRFLSSVSKKVSSGVLYALFLWESERPHCQARIVEIFIGVDLDLRV